jgi:hypothetical protein
MAEQTLGASRADIMQMASSDLAGLRAIITPGKA